MRVRLTLGSLLLFGRVGRFRILVGLGRFRIRILIAEVVKRISGFVTPAPVILEFTATPSLLKLRASGIASGRIVEIP